MISHQAILSLLAALAVATMNPANTSVMAAEDRRGLAGGINLCAAYDIVVPLIEEGTENCECDGRTIVCDFESVCDSDTDNCAALTMNIDFTQEGDEKITYKAEYDSTYEPVQLDLDVSSNPEEGIQACAASYGEGALCTCEVCGNYTGVDVNCGEGATTRGCSLVDLVNFERYVPFFGIGSNPVITRNVNSEAEDSSGAAAASIVLTTTNMFGALVASVFAFIAAHY